MEPRHHNANKQLVTGLIVVVMIAIVMGGVIISSHKSNSGPAGATITSSPASTTSNSSTSNSSFKDGVYSAAAMYTSPGGREGIHVDLTLQNGTVTAIDVTTNPSEREAQDYQNRFLSAYKQQVVGKKIADIRLGHVAGSSLTSQGFNEAIAVIKQQAQS